jgi:hypothetical protein
LISEQMPALSAHLIEHSVDVSLITTRWFSLVFVNVLPAQVRTLIRAKFIAIVLPHDNRMIEQWLAD